MRFNYIVREESKTNPVYRGPSENRAMEIYNQYPHRRYIIEEVWEEIMRDSQVIKAQKEFDYVG